MNKIFQLFSIITILGALSLPYSLCANTYLEGEEAYLESIEEAQEIEYNQKEMCVDVLGRCLDDEKIKIVEGVAVERDCWKYEYVKKCNNVPSKDNCAFVLQEDFKYVGDTCISKTKIGNKYFCLNARRIFTKTTYQKDKIDHSKIVMDPDDQGAAKELMCKAFCLDGNCDAVHKAGYQSNDEIAEAIAQLEMLSGIRKGMTDENNLNFNIFSGSAKHCHEKALNSSNCCDESGWLKTLGIQSCNPQVKELASQVRKKRCKPLGKYCAKRDKLTNTCWRYTYTYCCYPTVLAKTIRLAAEVQLGKGLGSSDNPQCGGLDISDIEALDFSIIDFKEFYNEEVQPMMKGYESQDGENLVKRSFPSGISNATSNSFAEPKTEGINEKLSRNPDIGDK